MRLWMAFALGLLLVAGASVLRMWDEEQEAALSAEADRLEQERRALEVVERERADFDRERAALAEKLSTLAMILPPEPQTERLIELLTRLADHHRVALVSTGTPARSRAGDFLGAVDLDVQVTGTPAALADFASGTGRLSRLVEVRRIDLRAHPAGAEATFGLRAFVSR